MSKVECEQCHREYEDNEEKCPRCLHRNPQYRASDDGNLLSPSSGNLGIDVMSGSPTIGLGGGLSIDLDDGGLNIGGIGLDGD